LQKGYKPVDDEVDRRPRRRRARPLWDEFGCYNCELPPFLQKLARDGGLFDILTTGRDLIIRSDTPLAGNYEYFYDSTVSSRGSARSWAIRSVGECARRERSAAGDSTNPRHVLWPQR
jgi:hypothetical protein